MSEQIEMMMRQVKLGGMAKGWRSVSFIDTEQYVADLLKLELQEREANRINRMVKTAGLFAVLMCLCGCAGQQDAAKTDEPVLADGLAKINVEGETELPGHFFLSFVYSRNLIMLDGKGNILWSKHEEQPAEDATTGFWDFKKHNVDGKTYYSYHDQNYSFDSYGLLGYVPGERVILDEDFNEVKRITMEASDSTEKGQGADGHDFLMIDPDHYILSCYVRENVKNVPGYPDGTNDHHARGYCLPTIANGPGNW